MSASLVGSEMCIRDRAMVNDRAGRRGALGRGVAAGRFGGLRAAGEGAGPARQRTDEDARLR
eukprot:5024713-Alexandrium_andersonii.AAC.1